MNNGWIKLHRRALHNDIRRKDPTAWRLFETILMLVDKNTGKWEGGRDQLAMADGSIKPTTIFKALRRLKNAQMVTLSSNNKYSTISICNWQEYQGFGNSSSNNKVTTKSQQSNTLTRSKNKEVRNNTYKDYEEFLKTFNESMGKNYRATDKQYQKYKLRRKVYDKDELLRVARDISKIPFMRGENDRGWQADQEYILRNDDNIDKILNNQTKRKVYEI